MTQQETPIANFNGKIIYQYDPKLLDTVPETGDDPRYSFYVLGIYYPGSFTAENNGTEIKSLSDLSFFIPRDTVAQTNVEKVYITKGHGVKEYNEQGEAVTIQEPEVVGEIVKQMERDGDFYVMWRTIGNKGGVDQVMKILSRETSFLSLSSKSLFQTDKQNQTWDMSLDAKHIAVVDRPARDGCNILRVMTIDGIENPFEPVIVKWLQESKVAVASFTDKIKNILCNIQTENDLEAFINDAQSLDIIEEEDDEEEESSSSEAESEMSDVENEDNEEEETNSVSALSDSESESYYDDSDVDEDNGLQTNTENQDSNSSSLNNFDQDDVKKTSPEKELKDCSVRSSELSSNPASSSSQVVISTPVMDASASTAPAPSQEGSASGAAPSTTTPAAGATPPMTQPETTQDPLQSLYKKYPLPKSEDEFNKNFNPDEALNPKFTEQYLAWALQSRESQSKLEANVAELLNKLGTVKADIALENAIKKRNELKEKGYYGNLTPEIRQKMQDHEEALRKSANPSAIEGFTVEVDASYENFMKARSKKRSRDSSTSEHEPPKKQSTNESGSGGMFKNLGRVFKPTSETPGAPSESSSSSSSSSEPAPAPAAAPTPSISAADALNMFRSRSSKFRSVN